MSSAATPPPPPRFWRLAVTLLVISGVGYAVFVGAGLVALAALVIPDGGGVVAVAGMTSIVGVGVGFLFLLIGSELLGSIPTFRDGRRKAA